MPLIIVRHPEILTFAVMSTLILIKLEEFVPLPVLRPSQAYQEIRSYGHTL